MCHVAQVHKLFESEVKIAKSRLDGMKLVLGADQNALEEYKKKYESKLTDGASTAGKKGTADVAVAPPCHMLKELRLLSEIKEAMEDKLAACTSDSELKTLKLEQKTVLAPGNALGAAMKSASVELKKAIDLNEKGKLGGTKPAAKRLKTDPLATPEKRKGEEPDIYETAFLFGQVLSSECRQIFESEEKPVAHAELLVPAVVVNKALVDEVMKGDGTLRSSVLTWKGTKWSTSSHRVQSGRAADSIQVLRLQRATINKRF